MAPADPQDAASGSVQKHRACDECRSRKLACSKEPTGCSRCRREGIVCHYSPQKQMGRPRKRRMVEESTSADDESPPVENVVAQSSVAQFGEQYGRQNVPSLGFPGDQGLSFLDEGGNSNLDFLDLLPYDYQDNVQLDPQILAPNDTINTGEPYSFPLSANGVDLFSGINFDEDPDSATTSMSKDISDSLQRYWQNQQLDDIEEPPEPTSSNISNNANSPESLVEPSSGSSSCSADHPPETTPKAIPSVNCGCLSSLYLSLDSLSRLPQDVMGAIRIARHATKVAHDVIRCPVCSGSLIEDPSQPPPIQCFQNLMCLAALVPSACNAYAGILEMVEKETADAEQNNRKIWFSFKDIGGLWGVVGSDHQDNCPRMAAFNNRDMEPHTWRTTMRAILRLDVYGFDEPPDDVKKSKSFKSRGLRDVLRLLEERSARRHAAMDHLHAEGKIPHSSPFLLHKGYKPVPPSERNCIRVLEAARLALDNLVIA